MNNEEIKEILDKLKADDNYNIDNNDGSAYKELFANEIYILLDYITNLQEQLHQASLDIQELTERDIECPSWCDKLTNLQEENEILKDSLETMTFTAKIKQEAIDSLIKRIDKAIEYINTHKHFDWHTIRNEKGKLDVEKIATDWISGNDLLNILQGSDKDE